MTDTYPDSMDKVSEILFPIGMVIILRTVAAMRHTYAFQDLEEEEEDIREWSSVDSAKINL